jgi:hypothetical protein
MLLKDFYLYDGLHPDLAKVAKFVLNLFLVYDGIGGAKMTIYHIDASIIAYDISLDLDNHHSLGAQVWFREEDVVIYYFTECNYKSYLYVDPNFNKEALTKDIANWAKALGA